LLPQNLWAFWVHVKPYHWPHEFFQKCLSPFST
jgi:hypothetical protein